LSTDTKREEEEKEEENEVKSTEEIHSVRKFQEA